MILSQDKTSFRFRVTRAIQEDLERNGIYFTLQPGSYRFHDGDVISCVKGAVVEPFVIFATTSIVQAGFASYISSKLETGVTIGRYCSIAENVKVMGPSHPTDRLSTNSFTYGDWSNIHVNPRKHMDGGPISLVGVKQRPPPSIDHDVWIGQDVLLARGIHLGIGSVIAAGSVVTKNVPPYAIVGGNPAKVIKFRLEESTAAMLLDSKWWNYAFPSFHNMPVQDPLAFLIEFNKNVKEETIKPYTPTCVDIMKLLFPDACEPS